MVSSARNPNESYAQRAKKANTSHAPSFSLKPPLANVWAERIKEQQAHASQVPRQRAASSPHPPRDDTIHPRSSPVQLNILDQHDEHDPFVVRVPPHLSRQSSSSTNPATDPSAWPPFPGPPQSTASSAGRDSPFLSAAPSRQSAYLPLFIP